MWSFLHSHPFYNSEQSSQRFVRLDEVRAFVPEGLSAEARRVYDGAVAAAWAAYRRLNDLLRPGDPAHHDASCATSRRTPPRSGASGSQREAEKKAIETARYVIPVVRLHLDGAHRLRHRAAPAVADDAHGRLPPGDRGGGLGHGRRGARGGPRVLRARGTGPPRGGRGRGDAASRPRPRASTPRRRASTPCSGTGSPCSWTTPRGARRPPRRRCGRSWATPASPCPTSDALERALNPSLNRYRLETLNLSVHSPLARALHHSTYTFLKKLSHTADSQDQRHRMVPGSRPLMLFTDTRRPDYVTPPLIAKIRGGARGLRGGDGRGLGGQEPAAGDGGAPRAGALRPAQRQGPALPRERQPALPRATSG